MTRVLPVPDGLIGVRFDQAMAKMLGISRTKAGALIADGQASVLGMAAQKSTRLGADDMLSIDLRETERHVEPEALGMEVLYEDEDIVVVNKPVGVAAHPSPGWTGPTVVGSLLRRGVKLSDYGPPLRKGVVSRLDVGTSGCMLLCKSNLAYLEMRKQFVNHDVDKTYNAIAQGDLLQGKATIDAPIARAKAADFRFTVTAAGKSAVTHYDVLERFGVATLVSVNLETGRTHQIRVHFSSIGHPLVGDPLYGSNPKLGERLGLTRQWLHASQLGFKHPRTRLWTVVRAPCPADLTRSLDILRTERAERGITAGRP